MIFSGAVAQECMRMPGQAGSFSRKEVTFTPEQGDRGRGMKLKAFRQRKIAKPEVTLDYKF